jgi:DNA-binding CsgD family transcriptional regulator
LAEGGHDREIPEWLASNALWLARGRLRLAEGRWQEALDDLVEFGRRDELHGAANPLASRWRAHAAFALAGMGRPVLARAMALEDLDRARQWSAASGVGVALRTAALLADADQSVPRLREAVEVLANSPARLEHARALIDLGSALRRANRRADARPFLKDGLERADRCGGRALAAVAMTELRAAGGTPSRRGAMFELTASERRVAELAADGYSNPEIAQALYVTRKTIETHLGHVYRKLGIAGRGELRPALNT